MVKALSNRWYYEFEGDILCKERQGKKKVMCLVCVEGMGVLTQVELKYFVKLNKKISNFVIINNITKTINNM